MVGEQGGGTAAVTGPETIRTRTGLEIVLRGCEGLEELGECVRLQRKIWGLADEDVVPRREFVVAQRVGGQVVGAFDGSRMVGFAMALPGMKGTVGGEPMPYLHSHMLAVEPEYRNAGIGRALKLYQRKEALARGIRLMEWTFDPLEIRNAFLNIHRLGVVVRTYSPDFYGVSSSRLQGGLPSDRLHAEWWMESDWVKAILNGSPTTPPEPQETIVVPRAVSEWKASSVSRALELQAENRRRFLDAFARGLTVTGFRVDSEGSGTFELARLQEPGQGVL